MKSNRRRSRAGRRWLVLAIVALLGLLSGCAGGDGDAVADNGEFTFVSPGGRTRLFYPPDERGRVTDLKGESLKKSDERIRLSDFEGEVVVLNIWGSWCPPCRAEAEDLQAVQDSLGDEGVQLLGIDVRDNRNAARDFVNNFGVTYPSIFDPSGRAMLALDGFPRSTTPATVVLDRRHRVAAIYLTAITEEELLPKVRDIASEGTETGSEGTAPKDSGPAEQGSRVPESGGAN
ncbi:TlpA family protein disulfide reductase [Actinopolyspora halophila]|uniref:TlpA family protein disulfide reductase n=1 Tax=Actinopolyspora halophila TaxID=1850 RepID=UPI0003709DF1|nr:TlpA disulfide reductase family protein [Actinopolyspora halophila]